MTVGRPLTYDREDALDEAMALFWQHGFEATSLHDLMAVMHLSKSSFYQGFGNKHDLFVQCLDRYRTQTTAMLLERLELADSGYAFLADTLEWAIEEAFGGVDPRGCLIMNTATEFAQRDQRIAQAVSDGLETYRMIFEAAAVRGQEEGSIRTDKEAAVLASYLVTTMSGLRTMVKAGTTRASLTAMIAISLDALEP